MTAHETQLRQLEDEFDDMLFARGFLLVEAPPRFVPSAWQSHRIAETFTLYVDPKMPVSTASSGGATVVVIGDVFSVRRPRWGQDRCTAELARTLARGNDALFRALDDAHGRFTLVFWTADSTSPRVVGDAACMRTVYFDLERAVAASHVELVAVNAARERDSLPVGRTLGTPGLRTGYDRVRFLPPNQVLEPRSGSFSRFWPRGPLVRDRHPQKQARKARRLMIRTLDGIVRRYPSIVMSLTAGTDSRTAMSIVLAAGRTDAVSFFTYVPETPGAGGVRDRDVAQELATTFRLQHRLLDFGGSGGSPLRRVLQVNTIRTHLFGLASVYRESFEPSVVHIRSNLSEIVRGYIRTQGEDAPWTIPDDVADYYLRSVRWRGHDNLADDEVAGIRDAFQEMFDLCDFGGATRFIEAGDVIYWEHRIATWHGQAILESDLAFQTFSLYNSRVVIESLLGFDLEDRIADRNLHEVMRLTDPRLLEFPLNGKTVDARALADAAPAPADSRSASRRMRGAIKQVPGAVPAVRWGRRTAKRVARRLKR